MGDAQPLGKKPGPRRLTDYTREIAHALIRKGHSKSSAIAIARGAQKKWARGGGHVSPKVRAGAAASIANQARLDKQKRVGLSNAGEASTVSLSMASSQDGPSMTMKMSPATAVIHNKLRAKGVPARLAVKMAIRAARKK